MVARQRFVDLVRDNTVVREVTFDDREGLQNPWMIRWMAGHLPAAWTPGRIRVIAVLYDEPPRGPGLPQRDNPHRVLVDTEYEHKNKYQWWDTERAEHDWSDGSDGPTILLETIAEELGIPVEGVDRRNAAAVIPRIRIFFMRPSDLPANTIAQIFRDSPDLHCILDPILEICDNKLLKAVGARTERRYKKIVKDCRMMKVEYAGGVPEDKMGEVCTYLGGRVNIQDVTGLVTWSKVRSYGPRKRPSFVLNMLNTRLHHADPISKLVKPNPDMPLVTQDEMQRIFKELKDKGEFMLYTEVYKSRKHRIREILTPTVAYRYESPYQKCAKKFNEALGSRRFDMNHASPMAKFVRLSLHTGGAMTYPGCQKTGQMRHIDMKNAFANAHRVTGYRGFPAIMSYFKYLDLTPRETRQFLATHVGFVFVTDVCLDKCAKNMAEHLRTLNFLTREMYDPHYLDADSSLPLEDDRNTRFPADLPHAVYDGLSLFTPLLLQLWDYGVRFRMRFGAWSPTTIDIKFDEYMFEKQDGVPHYCRWSGSNASINCVKSYRMSSYSVPVSSQGITPRESAVQFAKVLEEHGAKTRVYELGEDEYDIRLQVGYEDKHIRHRTHWLAAHAGYTIMSTLQQLAKIRHKRVIRVVADGIYFSGAGGYKPQLVNEFRYKDSNSAFTAQWKRFVSNCYEDDADKMPVPHEDARYTPADDHMDITRCGPGGSGKTHSVLMEKGLEGLLYVAHSHDLANNKKDKYGLQHIAVHSHIHQHRYKMMYFSAGIMDGKRYFCPGHMVVDECTLLTRMTADKIREEFPHTVIHWCGDMHPTKAFSFQMVYGCPMRPMGHLIEYTKNYRVEEGDPLLAIVDGVRQLMVEGHLDIPELPEVPSGFRVHSRVNSLMTNHLKRFNQETLGNVRSMLGCSLEELQLYLEQQFEPQWTWDGYGTDWNLDHIIPIQTLKTNPEMVHEIAHYSNLKPMVPHENQSKGCRHGVFQRFRSGTWEGIVRYLTQTIPWTQQVSLQEARDLYDFNDVFLSSRRHCANRAAHKTPTTQCDCEPHLSRNGVWLFTQSVQDKFHKMKYRIKENRGGRYNGQLDVGDKGLTRIDGAMVDPRHAQTVHAYQGRDCGRTTDLLCDTETVLPNLFLDIDTIFSPKPNMLYTMLSRATCLSQVHLVRNNEQLTPDQQLEEPIVAFLGESEEIDMPKENTNVPVLDEIARRPYTMPGTGRRISQIVYYAEYHTSGGELRQCVYDVTTGCVGFKKLHDMQLYGKYNSGDLYYKFDKYLFFVGDKARTNQFVDRMRAVPLQRRHYHEHVPPDRQRRPYFDIEWVVDSDTPEEHDVLTNEVWPWICARWLQMTSYDIQPDDFVVNDGSTQTTKGYKLSYHLFINSGQVFRDAMHIHKFMQAFFEHCPIEVLRRMDTGVYRKRGWTPMRLTWCTKDEDLRRHSPLNGPFYCIGHDMAGKVKRKPAILIKQFLLSSLVLEPEDTSMPYAVPRLIKEIAHRMNRQLARKRPIRDKYQKSRVIYTLKNTRSEACPFANRVHNHSWSRLIADIESGTVYFACLNPGSCKHESIVYTTPVVTETEEPVESVE